MHHRSVDCARNYYYDLTLKLAYAYRQKKVGVAGLLCYSSFAFVAIKLTFAVDLDAKKTRNLIFFMS